MVKLWSNNYFFLKEDVISKFIVIYTYYTCNFKILLSNLHVNQNFWDLQKISKSVKLEIGNMSQKIRGHVDNPILSCLQLVIVRDI